VVLDLVQKAKLSAGCEVFFDNLFTSFPLLNKLSEMGVAGTGTVRQNRLNKVAINTKKELMKKTIPRGHLEAVFREDQVLAVWKDNKPVFVASNKYEATVSGTVGRYCRVQKKKIQVPIPDCVRQYNSFMGGVDQLDNSVACYRIPYRMKKWWFALYAWTINASVVNAWRLRMKFTGRKEPLLDFLRELVVEMLQTHGKPPLIRRGSLGPAGDQRTDGLNHWIVATDTTEDGKKRRLNCRQCSKEGKKDNKTLMKCEKCNVGLHHLCFKEKHSLPILFQIFLELY